MIRSLRAILCALLPLAPLQAAAAAVSGAPNSYTPPKLLVEGSAPTPAASGRVTVQIFIAKDGTPGSAKIVRSSNHADDSAAVEIAKTSRYKAAVRGGTPVDAFYTMTLQFNGAISVRSLGGDVAPGLRAANAALNAEKYGLAKTQAESYLSAHPRDAGAENLLGVADFLLKDAAGATAAFDAGGTIPRRFRIVAARAYADAAMEQLKAKNYAQSIALGKKSLALQENVNSMFVLGTAYANSRDYPNAVTVLERARARAVSSHAGATTLNAIDVSLATSYIFGGQTEKGVALAKALRKRDPSNTRVDDALATYYNQEAVKTMNAGKTDDAVEQLEQAASLAPARAVALYVQAANVLARAPIVDWKRVRAEADKALALDGGDARANYVAGIAQANAGDTAGAIPYLQRAKGGTGADAALSTDIDAALKKLGQK
ncbi:MAG: TonB family protein [Candidatus Eremiobacteraeota bacterium]|nr:TonB family protein [Candidatus Eremiobacteraeota bacterium]